MTGLELIKEAWILIRRVREAKTQKERIRAQLALEDWHSRLTEEEWREMEQADKGDWNE